MEKRIQGVWTNQRLPAKKKQRRIPTTPLSTSPAEKLVLLDEERNALIHRQNELIERIAVSLERFVQNSLLNVLDLC